MANKSKGTLYRVPYFMKEGEQMLQALFTNNIDCVTVEGLTQWDMGQELQITLSGLPSSFQVHFANKGSKEAYVVEATATSGVAIVPIPNAVLRSDKTVVAWVYITGTETGETIRTIILPITPRTKPSDYVYIETGTLTYNIVIAEAMKVLESEANAKEYMETAKDYMESAKESELLAEMYKNTAFSGTPEGYEALVEQVNRMDIATSSDYTLPNSKKGGYRLNDLVGNTVQNGEPTPSTPLAIENTFDCVEMTQGNYDLTSGKYVSNDKYICSKRSIPCKSGDVIKLSLENLAEVARIFYYNDNTFVSASASANVTKFNKTVPDGVNNFKFAFNHSSGLDVETFGKIQLTVNGKYVGQIVEHGKNLLGNVVKATNSTFDSVNGRLVGTATINTTLSTGKIQLFNNGTFVRELIAEIGSGIRVIELIKDATFNQIVLGFNGNKQDQVVYFDISHLENGVTYYIQFNVGTLVANGGTISNIMITTSSTYDDTYEPYTEKVTTFYLNEPLRATDRIVRKDGVIYENHRRGSVVLEGSKFVSDYSSGETKGLYWTTQFDSLAVGNFDTLCTHFVKCAGTSANINELQIHNATTNKVCFIVDRAQFPTLADFKTWVDENNVIVEYDLAEETYTPLDTDSQLALNDMVTFNGTTHIEVDSKIPPTSISGEYGTSQVGAYTLKAMNVAENNAIKIEDAVNTMLLIGAQ